MKILGCSIRQVRYCYTNSSIHKHLDSLPSPLFMLGNSVYCVYEVVVITVVLTPTAVPVGLGSDHPDS